MGYVAHQPQKRIFYKFIVLMQNYVNHIPILNVKMIKILKISSWKIILSYNIVQLIPFKMYGCVLTSSPINLHKHTLTSILVYFIWLQRTNLQSVKFIKYTPTHTNHKAGIIDFYVSHNVHTYNRSMCIRFVIPGFLGKNHWKNRNKK